MYYTFQSIDKFLFSIETEVVNTLYDYGLLNKFDSNVKKIIFYLFVQRLCERLNADNDLLFYHDSALSGEHELFRYYDGEKLAEYLESICQKIKKVTNRIFFLKSKTFIPTQSLLGDLDGRVIDEILLLKVRRPVDPKTLRDFLKKNNLFNLFETLSKKVCA